MSEEEKKAMEILKNTRQAWCRILSRYIDKQQKEIEALEIIHNTYKEMIEENNYISKDKIREKIKKAKEIKWQIPKLVIEYFEELLEEN